MSKTLRKSLSLFLALVMALSCMSLGAFAEDTDEANDATESVSDAVVEDAQAEESNEDAQTAESVEEVQDTEAAEDTEEAQNTEAAEDTEEAQNTEAAEAAEEVQDTEAAEAVEEVQDTEAAEGAEEAQDTEAAEGVEEVQNPEEALKEQELPSVPEQVVEPKKPVVQEEPVKIEKVAAPKKMMALQATAVQGTAPNLSGRETIAVTANTTAGVYGDIYHYSSMDNGYGEAPSGDDTAWTPGSFAVFKALTVRLHGLQATDIIEVTTTANPTKVVFADMLNKGEGFAESASSNENNVYTYYFDLNEIISNNTEYDWDTILASNDGSRWAGIFILGQSDYTATITVYRGESTSTSPALGTEANPYTISSITELIDMRDKINGEDSANYANAYWKLTEDIDLADQTWTPIGNDYYKSGKYTNGYKTGKAFTGTFDGAGHTISNLKVATVADSSDTANGGGWAAGLFGIIKGGTVKNLTINNANVSSATRFAGAVAGGMTGGTIIGVNVTGEITISGRHFVGGIAGMSYGTIQGCSVTATGTISADDTRELANEADRDGDDVGGIVGYINSTGVVRGSSVESADLTVQGLRQVGAIVGNNNGGTMVAGSDHRDPKVITYSARIGNTNYTLEAAFAAAQNDQTITLLSDVTLTDRLFVNAGTTPAYAGSNNRYATTSENKSITLDLNNHNISSASNIALAGGSLNITGTGTISTTNDGLAPVEIRGTGNLDAKRTLTIGENVTLSGADYGLNIFGDNNSSNPQKNYIDVIINGTVNGTVFVLGNLKNTENEINITVNGTVTANPGSAEDVSTGIALNGYANVTVNDGATITGESGIEVRAGELTVNGGTITATAESYSYEANNSGTTTKGAAIAVAQHNTELPTKATINGGTLTGTKKIGVTNVNNDMSDVTVMAAEDYTDKTSIPEDYAWVASAEAGMKKLGVAGKITVENGTDYATLEDAVAAVNKDKKITVTDNTTIGSFPVTAGSTVTVTDAKTADNSSVTAKEVEIKSGDITTTAYVVSKGDDIAAIAESVITKNETVKKDAVDEDATETEVSDYVNIAQVLANVVEKETIADLSSITSMVLSLEKETVGTGKTVEGTGDAKGELQQKISNPNIKVFDVYPEATVTTTNGTETTQYTYDASKDLADDASFTFKLKVGTSDDAGSTAKMTHYHNGANGWEASAIPNATVDENGEVTVTLTEFSYTTLDSLTYPEDDATLTIALTAPAEIQVDTDFVVNVTLTSSVDTKLNTYQLTLDLPTGFTLVNRSGYLAQTAIDSNNKLLWNSATDNDSQDIPLSAGTPVSLGTITLNVPKANAVYDATKTITVKDVVLTFQGAAFKEYTPTTITSATTKVTTKYNITWDYNGGTLDSQSSRTDEVGVNVTPTEPAPTKDGYTLNGWSPEIVAATAVATYTAQWTPTSYTLTINNYNNQSDSKTYNILTPATLTVPAARDGYTFNGWKVTTAAGNWTENEEIAASATTTPTGKYGDATLTEQWTANSYTVTITQPTGVGEVYTGASSYQLNPANPLVIPAPTKVGYTFAGWKASNAAGSWVNGTTYTTDALNTTGHYGSVTLTATWTLNIVEANIELKSYSYAYAASETDFDWLLIVEADALTGDYAYAYDGNAMFATKDVNYGGTSTKEVYVYIVDGTLSKANVLAKLSVVEGDNEEIARNGDLNRDTYVRQGDLGVLVDLYNSSATYARNGVVGVRARLEADMITTDTGTNYKSIQDINSIIAKLPNN